MGLFARKSIAVLQNEAGETGEDTLKRVLTASNLTLLGIGAIIGAGIFVLTGTAAALLRRTRRRATRSCSPGSAASSRGSATPSSRR